MMRAPAAIAAGVLALTLTASSAPDRTPKPSRSACIAGVYADWARVADAGASFQAMRRAVLYPWGRGTPSVAYQYDEKDSPPTRIYFQFPRDCARKHERVDRIVALWRATVADLPQITPIAEPILPGRHTIDESGPLWADGPYYDYYNQWQNPSRGP